MTAPQLPHSPRQLWGACLGPCTAGHPARTAGPRCRQAGRQGRGAGRGRQAHCQPVVSHHIKDLFICIARLAYMPESALVHSLCPAHLMGLSAGYCTSCVCIASYSSSSVLPCTRAAAGTAGSAGACATPGASHHRVVAAPAQLRVPAQAGVVAPTSHRPAVACKSPIRDPQGSTGTRAGWLAGWLAGLP